MKTILITTLSALLLGLPLSRAVSPDAQEESMTQQIHQFWIKSKGYLTEDWSTFQTGARATIADLSKQIDAVAAKTDKNTPAYFQLRLQALKEQRDFLLGKLTELTAETIKTRMSGPRYIFDKCISALESAITQADNEANALNWISKSDEGQATRVAPPPQK